MIKIQRPSVDGVLYTGLFLLLAFSVSLLATGSSTSAWRIYSHIYFYMLVAYTWFIFGLLCYGDMNQRTYKAINKTMMAVIIPCFNEDPELLRRCIESVVNAKGYKKIIVIDDGSGSTEQLRKLVREYGLIAHYFRRNKGKRHALHYAVKNLVGGADFVVTIDSDTVLDQDALIEIIKPFSDPKVGATSGDVRLLNEKQNILTRMVASYYWIGLHIYKKAQSSVGMVVCCSGCLSAYRTPVIKSIIDRFVNQRFLGERCTHSEDRHLTNLILQGRYDVKFVPEAISYTNTPSTVAGFLKQQQRWKRGYIRESLYTLTYAWRTRPLLFIEIIFWELTIPFFAFGLMVALIISVMLSPAFFINTVLPSWIIFMLVRYLPVFILQPKRIFGLLVYMFFYDIFLYWQSVYALFTVKNKSWITR